jgi:leader peptidase (prepilin peptidase)/N-methyltransferase
MGLAALAALVVVVVAALAGAGWLAGAIERVGAAASGPCAGEPGLAWDAGTAVVISPARRAAPTRRSDVVGGPVAGGRGLGGPAAGPAGVGVAAASLGGALAWVVGSAPVLPALVLLAGVGMVLAAVDVRTHRLPDALVLPAYPALALLLSLAATREGLAPLARAAEGGLVAFGVLYVLAFVLPAGLGYGDVKLAGLLGAALAWYGWPVLLRGLVLGFGYGGLCAAALLVTRRTNRRASLAYGPFLLAGALTVVVLAA